MWSLRLSLFSKKIRSCCLKLIYILYFYCFQLVLMLCIGPVATTNYSQVDHDPLSWLQICLPLSLLHAWHGYRITYLLFSDIQCIRLKNLHPNKGHLIKEKRHHSHVSDCLLYKGSTDTRKPFHHAVLHKSLHIYSLIFHTNLK